MAQEHSHRGPGRGRRGDCRRPSGGAHLQAEGEEAAEAEAGAKARAEGEAARAADARHRRGGLNECVVRLSGTEYFVSYLLILEMSRSPSLTGVVWHWSQRIFSSSVIFMDKVNN